MKKLILLFLIFCTAVTVQSQTDFVISGYVTNSSNLAVNNHQVCVHTPTSSVNPFYGCVFTNPNGWYSILIPNGSMSGSNQVFYVTTMSCDSSMYIDTVSNMQGTVTSATVNFTNVNTPSVGGTLTASVSTINQGNSTGAIVLTNHVGTVLRWEKRLNQGAWVHIAFTGTSYTETPAVAAHGNTGLW